MYVDIDDKVFGPERSWWGTRSREGTLLAEISIPEINDEAKQKEAQAVQAHAEVELSRKNLTVAEANLTSSRAMTAEAVAAEKQAHADYDRWQSESIRIDGLVKRGTIDKQASEETRRSVPLRRGGLGKSQGTYRFRTSHQERKQSKKRACRGGDRHCARPTGCC